jgi:hypothetical protein
LPAIASFKILLEIKNQKVGSNSIALRIKEVRQE